MHERHWKTLGGVPSFFAEINPAITYYGTWARRMPNQFPKATLAWDRRRPAAQ